MCDVICGQPTYNNVICGKGQILFLLLKLVYLKTFSFSLGNIGANINDATPFGADDFVTTELCTKHKKNYKKRRPKIFQIYVTLVMENLFWNTMHLIQNLNTPDPSFTILLHVDAHRYWKICS